MELLLAICSQSLLASDHCDGCGILLTNVGTSLTAWPSRWTPQKMIHMEYCRSGLQIHRGNAIETPCRSAAEFAILLPNISIPIAAPRCSKAYIIQLKACIKPDRGIWQPGQCVHPSGIYPKSTFPKGLEPRINRLNTWGQRVNVSYSVSATGWSFNGCWWNPHGNP